MANVDYRDLFWMVRAELPNVPLPLLFSNYANAVREFFSKSKAWQHNCPNALSLAASTAWPSLTEGTDYPTDTYIVEPVKVKWSDGEVINFKTRDQLDQADPDWEQATGTRAKFWTITSPGEWRMYPLLSSAVSDTIYLRVAVAPKLTMSDAATAVPQYLADEFSEVWAHGALSKLMKIPGKDWTNVNLAAQYGQMFEQGIKMAKSRAAADFGRPVRTVQYGGLSIGGSGERHTDDYGR